MPITPETIASIKVLYRDKNLMLWGIPYEMRTEIGQAPRHLQEAGNTKGWIYLGSPGWWGNLSKEEQELAKNFLKNQPSLEWWGEWCYVQHLP